jgi:hypothetical protein
MLYTKPELVRLAAAQQAIQGQPGKPDTTHVDGTCDFKTIPAYEADE